VLDQFDPAASLRAAAAVATPSAVLATASGADLAAQAAALKLLTSTLAVAGPVLPPDVRAHMDATAYHVAQTAAAAVQQLRQDVAVNGSGGQLRGGLQPMDYSTVAVNGTVNTTGQTCFGAGDVAVPMLVVLQRAAYEALLASVLSPCGHRPPYLTEVRGVGWGSG
jgi:hypothetical protein